MDRRIELRMLCADLVDIQWKDPNGRTRRGVANLEDISLSGACLQVDRPVPLGSALHITYPGELSGKVNTVYSGDRLFPGVELTTAAVGRAASAPNSSRPRRKMNRTLNRLRRLATPPFIRSPSIPQFLSRLRVPYWAQVRSPATPQEVCWMALAAYGSCRLPEIRRISPDGPVCMACRDPDDAATPDPRKLVNQWR
jgi:hypothetical protein